MKVDETARDDEAVENDDNVAVEGDENRVGGCWIEHWRKGNQENGWEPMKA